MNLLEMKHVKKTFDNLEVLKDISIEVKEESCSYHRPIGFW